MARSSGMFSPCLSAITRNCRTLRPAINSMEGNSPSAASPLSRLIISANGTALLAESPALVGVMFFSSTKPVALEQPMSLCFLSCNVIPSSCLFVIIPNALSLVWTEHANRILSKYPHWEGNGGGSLSHLSLNGVCSFIKPLY